MTAIAYYRLRKYKDAYEWFCKAEEAGVRDSLALFTDSAAGCTMDLWNEARNLVLQSEVTQGAAYALLSAYFTVRSSPREMLRLQIFRFLPTVSSFSCSWR